MDKEKNGNAVKLICCRDIKEEMISAVIDEGKSTIEVFNQYQNEYKVTIKSFYRWIQQARKKKDTELTPQEAELIELKNKLIDTQIKLWHAEKIIERYERQFISRKAPIAVYQKIKRDSAEKCIPIIQLCKGNNVSRSGFYYWLKDVWVFEQVAVKTNQGNVLITVVFDSCLKCIVGYTIQFQKFSSSISMNPFPFALVKTQYPLIIHNNTSISPEKLTELLIKKNYDSNQIIVTSKYNWNCQDFFKQLDGTIYSSQEEAIEYIKVFINRYHYEKS